jgi:hypothetical protein
MPFIGEVPTSRRLPLLDKSGKGRAPHMAAMALRPLNRHSITHDFHLAGSYSMVAKAMIKRSPVEGNQER